MSCLVLSFFFQAEDGIRDHCVTGVQTCALPISTRGTSELDDASSEEDCMTEKEQFLTQLEKELPTTMRVLKARSEERRVGKEGRSGWSPDELKKTNEMEKGLEEAVVDA